MSSKKRKNKLNRRAHATFVSPYKKRDGTRVKGHMRRAPRHRVYKMVRKPETDEWAVKAYDDGVYNEEATYYTDDKEDAIATKSTLIRQEIERRRKMERSS